MKPDKNAAWITPTPPLAVTVAIKALNNGTADPDQQQRALRWIVEELCAAGGWAYRPDARETDIALGMQRVGIAIIKEINISITKLKESENG